MKTQWILINTIIVVNSDMASVEMSQNSWYLILLSSHSLIPVRIHKKLNLVATSMGGGGGIWNVWCSASVGGTDARECFLHCLCRVRTTKRFNECLKIVSVTFPDQSEHLKNLLEAIKDMITLSAHSHIHKHWHSPYSFSQQRVKGALQWFLHCNYCNR